MNGGLTSTGSADESRAQNLNRQRFLMPAAAGYEEADRDAQLGFQAN